MVGFLCVKDPESNNYSKKWQTTSYRAEKYER